MEPFFLDRAAFLAALGREPSAWAWLPKATPDHVREPVGPAPSWQRVVALLPPCLGAPKDSVLRVQPTPCPWARRPSFLDGLPNLRRGEHLLSGRLTPGLRFGLAHVGNFFDLCRLLGSDPTNVLVDGNLITAIGPDVHAGANATVINGGGRVLMPGMSDTHVHLTFASIPIEKLLNGFYSYPNVRSAVDANKMLMHGLPTVAAGAPARQSRTHRLGPSSERLLSSRARSRSAASSCRKTTAAGCRAAGL